MFFYNFIAYSHILWMHRQIEITQNPPKFSHVSTCYIVAGPTYWKADFAGFELDKYKDLHFLPKVLLDY